MLGTPKTKGNNKDFDLLITTAPIPDLNDHLLVFGRVLKGEDVVQVCPNNTHKLFFIFCGLFYVLTGEIILIQEIEEVDTDEHYQPKSPIGIISIILKQKI